MRVHAAARSGKALAGKGLPAREGSSEPNESLMI